MGWKVIHLTKPCKIKVKDSNLLILFKDSSDEIKITIKDIDFILFDNTQFSITGKAIELLSKNSTAVLLLNSLIKIMMRLKVQEYIGNLYLRIKLLEENKEVKIS